MIIKNVDENMGRLKDLCKVLKINDVGFYINGELRKARL